MPLLLHKGHLQHGEAGAGEGLRVSRAPGSEEGWAGDVSADEHPGGRILTRAFQGV